MVLVTAGQRSRGPGHTRSPAPPWASGSEEEAQGGVLFSVPSSDHMRDPLVGNGYTQHNIIKASVTLMYKSVHLLPSYPLGDMSLVCTLGAMARLPYVWLS